METHRRGVYTSSAWMPAWRDDAGLVDLERLQYWSAGALWLAISSRTAAARQVCRGRMPPGLVQSQESTHSTEGQRPVSSARHSRCRSVRTSFSRSWASGISVA